MGCFEISGVIGFVILIIMNIGILVIGVYLNMRGSPFYGGIINIETEEWSKSPILSIVSNSSF
jgi:hypothetical protein